MHEFQPVGKLVDLCFVLYIIYKSVSCEPYSYDQKD